MYQAIGIKTKTIYIQTESKSDLIRQLSEGYQWQSDDQYLYPEPLKIENLNRSLADFENLTRKERKKILLTNVENEKISEFLGKEFRQEEVPINRRDGQK